MVTASQLALFGPDDEAGTYHDQTRTGFFSLLVAHGNTKRQDSYRLTSMATVLNMVDDCARLISNCIIYYNSALLSAFLQIQERNGRQDVVDVISRLSPVAWQHINLNGEYAFNKDRKEIDLAGLLSDVESIS